MRTMICGIDEVGRGCLAGPVTAASVIFLTSDFPKEIILNDSKKLSKKQREENINAIKLQTLWGIGWVNNSEIDKINIHNASLLAMERSFYSLLNNIQSLPLTDNKNQKSFHFDYLSEYTIPDLDLSMANAIVDGKFAPNLPISVTTQIKADSIIPEVQAASILAKVSRDSLMYFIDSQIPEYCFNKHKGYPTKLHKQRIKKYGISHIHRQTFSPIKEICDLNPYIKKFILF